MAENDEGGVRSSPGAQKQNPFGVVMSSRLAQTWAQTAIFIFFLVVLVAGAFICWTYFFVVIGDGINGAAIPKRDPNRVPNKIKIPLNCSNAGTEQTCPSNYPTKFEPYDVSPTSCPDYFRWIHRDLDTWRESGITRELLEQARPLAHFRLVILNGKAYLEQYHGAFQTRDVFTIWGILQLLRFYPGKVPDLELMFWLDDRPVIWKRDYQGNNAKWPPPPGFHYCGHEDALDIVFPDWSFWGWPEVNVKPWNNLREAIREGNKRIKWKDRVPYAFWKGNPNVSNLRKELMKCNSSDSYDPNVHLFVQDWGKEIQEQFKNSNLEDQCTYRYKIYIEGVAWSVSQKYILACDSMTLLIKPVYYDFFIRGMVPMQHYWPIRPQNKCRDLKFAVDWGNNNTDTAEAIGKEGSGFILNNLKMDYVYDYMFHLLSEYAKLLKFKVKVPEGAIEICSETRACHMDGLVRKFMEDSMVMSPSEKVPCAIPPPYGKKEFEAVLKNKESIEKQVEMWESEYWERLSKKNQ